MREPELKGKDWWIMAGFFLGVIGLMCLGLLYIR